MSDYTILLIATIYFNSKGRPFEAGLCVLFMAALLVIPLLVRVFQ